MQNLHCLFGLVSGFGCNLDSTRTLPFTAQPLSIFPAEKGGKFYNFLIFGILLPPKLPHRVKPECRVNLSVDKAGKAVSRHISFYQRIPEVVMRVVCSFFWSICVFLFHMEGNKICAFFVEDINVSFRRAFHIFYSEYYTLQLQTKSRYFKLQRAS